MPHALTQGQGSLSLNLPYKCSPLNLLSSIPFLYITLGCALGAWIDIVILLLDCNLYFNSGPGCLAPTLLTLGSIPWHL